MVRTTICIENGEVNVSLQKEQEIVCVMSAFDNRTYKLFAGIPDLKESFELFQQTFGFLTSYEEAVEYFTPTIKITI